MKKKNNLAIDDFKTIFSHYVYQFDKLKYFKERKNQNDGCILCSLIENKFDSLIIGKTCFTACCVNLYPYNSGHLMIFPVRHVESYLDLKEEESLDLFKLTQFFMKIIDKIYGPQGYNIGMNLGQFSGASIKHIHQHIVPRFSNELGMIDIIGGSKVMVESPLTTKKRIIDYIKNEITMDFDFELY